MAQILSVLALLLPIVIIAITLSFATPIYPLLAQDLDVSPVVETAFFALYSVPYLFNFCYLPTFERKCGAKPTYLAHLLLCTLATFLMSSFQFITSATIFSIISLLLQFINGIGGAGINYQYYILAQRLFHSDFALMNEIPVTLFTLFYGIAPLISAQVSAAYGFNAACYTVASIILLVTIYARWTLPEQGCDPSPQQVSELRLRLTYCQFLKRPRVFATMLILFLSYFLVAYFLPFLALELHLDLKVSKGNLGNLFMLNALGGILGATPGVLILRRCLRFSSIIVIGVISGLLGNILMGFCPLFKIPHSVEFVYAGFFFIGIGFSLISVPILPYLVFYYQTHPSELKGIQNLSPVDQKDQITSKSVGSYSFTIGLALLIAPIFGRGFYGWIGYERTFAVVSAMIVVFGVVFLIFGGVFQKGEEDGNHRRSHNPLRGKQEEEEENLIEIQLSK